MTTIGIILVIVAVLVALPLIAALLIRKEYSVERDIQINLPKEKVFDYVKYLKNQDSFSKWANIDPDMKKSYRGTDGYAGFVSAWDSNNKNVGKGEQEIKKITDGTRIDYEIRFIRPFKSTSPAYMTTESISDNQTRVKWGFSGNMKYPMNIMFLFMNFEKMIGNDLVTGLTNLKNKLESKI
jgi:hypothetical protein